MFGNDPYHPIPQIKPFVVLDQETDGGNAFVCRERKGVCQCFDRKRLLTGQVFQKSVAYSVEVPVAQAGIVLGKADIAASAICRMLFSEIRE